MSRAALELIGQGGLGYSFDSLTENKSNAYGEALKGLLCVEDCGTSAFTFVLTVPQAHSALGALLPAYGTVCDHSHTALHPPRYCALCPYSWLEKVVTRG